MLNFKKNFLRNLDILFFIIIVTIKLCIYTKVSSGIMLAVFTAFIPILASVLILCSISLPFEYKTRTKILYIINLIVTCMITADIVYYGYYKDVLSIPVLRNSLLLKDVKSSVFSLLHPSDFIIFIDLIIMRPSVFKKIRGDAEKQSLPSRLILFTPFIIVGLILEISSMKVFSKQQPGLMKTMYNRIYIAEYLGNTNFHFLDTYNFVNNEVSKNKSLPTSEQDKIKKYFSDNKNKYITANLKGTYKGKNLIIIQVEALQGFVINNKVNGQEITPNLNKFIKRSTYFDNYYYQVSSGNTSDAEFMTNNSLFPAANGVACYLYCNNTFDSIAKGFNAQGYKTYAMHGYKGAFWNRTVMNNQEGYSKFYSDKDYKQDEIVGMGLSDKSFLNQSFNILKNSQQPYYSFLVTLSSHFPFDAGSKYGNFDTGDYKGSLLGNYMQGIHYTDEQLGMFLDKLDKAGILDNSVVAIYGDHYAIPRQEESNLNKLLNITNPTELTWMELQKVPLIVHFPGDKNAGTNHLYAGEMDINPTMSNLFGLTPKYEMGTDLFNVKENTVTFRNGTFTDGHIFYLSQFNKYYNISTGNVIPETPELKAEKADSANKLKYSDELLDHNMIKKFTNSK